MTFRPETADAFLPVYGKASPLIRSFPGCRELRLYRDTHNPNVFFTYSVWDREEDLEAYRASPLFAETWKEAKALFAEKAEAWSVMMV